MRLVALIEEARIIRRILGHLGLPTDGPAARPARSPPSVFDSVDDGDGANAVP